MAIEWIVFNLSPKVRRETWEGRQYLVDPLTLIVPGVLNGSRGPLYYPLEEVARDPGIWNGVPLTVGHPRDTLTNEHISGRSPPVIERLGIGYVFNDRIDEKGHRVAEGWFDIAKTRTVDKRILNALEAGKPIELSTGLYTDNEPAPTGATANGRPYAFIARNYRSDHVAILPDESGACSVNDGCGVLVNTPTREQAAAELRRNLVKAGKWLSKNGLMEGYGQVFFKADAIDAPETGEVWYVGGDGDEKGFGKLVNKKLSLPGVSKVFYEAEAFPPEDEGWEQVYPDKATRNANPEGCNQYKDCVEGGGSSSKLSVGDAVTYTGVAGGPTPAEFRGYHSHPDTGEKMARIIVRAPGESLFETSAKLSQVSKGEQPTKPEGEKTDVTPAAATDDIWAQIEKAKQAPEYESKQLASHYESRGVAQLRMARSASDRKAAEKLLEASRHHKLAAAAHESGNTDAAEKHSRNADRALEGKKPLRVTGNSEDTSVSNLSFLQKFLGWFTGNTEEVSVVNAPPNQPRSKVTGRLKRLNAGTGIGDAHESAQRGALQLTDRDRELGKAAAAEKAATGNNPASWVADEDIWEKAKAAADKGDYEKDSDTYWAVVAHIYQQMGGTSKSENATTKNTKTTKKESKEETENTNNSSEGGTSPATNKGDTMPMTKEERQKAVANLTANCSCKESKVKEEVALNQLSDEFLKSLLGNVQAGTAAAKGFQHGGKVFVFNGERGKFVVNAMKGDAEDEAECNPDSPDYDEEECRAMNKKTKNATSAKNRGDMGDSKTRMAAFARMVEDGDCDTCDDKEDNASRSGRSNVGNSKSLSEWLNGAPPEIRSVVTNAMAVEKQARVQLVRRIVANLEGAQRKRMIERLADKPLDELRDLALLTRPTDNEAVPSLSMADYSGAAGAPVDNQADFDESDVGWAAPTMNWEQMAEENRKSEGRRRA